LHDGEAGVNTGEFEALRVHVDDARDECREGQVAITNTLHKFREDVTNKIFLQDNRIQRLESDAGRKKISDEQTQAMLTRIVEQNALQLLNQKVAGTEIATTVKNFKFALIVGIPTFAFILAGLVWLIQHVGAK
jgi:hypothetical protein